jgi:hypothetical protein
VNNTGQQPPAALQNETTQTGGAICVAHLCHVDLVRLNWGERLAETNLRLCATQFDADQSACHFLLCQLTQ